jgi:hypothetical protein
LWSTACGLSGIALTWYITKSFDSLAGINKETKGISSVREQKYPLYVVQTNDGIFAVDKSNLRTSPNKFGRE